MDKASIAAEGPNILVKIRAVVCPMLVMLIVGSYFCFSNTNTYVAAYLNSMSPVEITDTDTLLVMPLWMMTHSLFAIVSVRLADSMGYWALNITAFSLFSLVNLLASYVTSYKIFIFVYGILTGASMGLGFLPGLYIAWTYFPNKKSLVTGSIMFCSGVSGMIISPITTLIINPNNVDIDFIRSSPEVYNNVPKMFRIMAAIFGSISLVAGLLQPGPYVPKSAVKDLEEIKAAAAEEELGVDVTNMLKEELINDLNKAPYYTNTLILGQLTDENVEKLSLTNPGVLQKVRSRLGSMHSEMNSGEEDVNNDNTGEETDTNHALEIYQVNEERGEYTEERDLSIVESNGRNSVITEIKNESHRISNPDPVIDTLENKEAQAQNLSEEAQYQVTYECPDVKTALLSWPFLNLCVMAFCCSIYNAFLNSAWKKFYSSQFEVDDSKMALLLSVGSLTNSIFRLLIGILLMYFSFKTIYIWNLILAIFSSLTVLQFTTSYNIGALYLGFAFGGVGTHITLFPTICLQVFGPVVGPKIYPCVYFMFSVAMFAQYLILKLAHEDWQLVTRILAGVSILGIIIIIPFKPEYDWRPKAEQIKKEELEDETNITIDDSENQLKLSLLKSK